jgi:mannose PTS system EIIA component
MNNGNHGRIEKITIGNKEPFLYIGGPALLHLGIFGRCFRPAAVDHERHGRAEFPNGRFLPMIGMVLVTHGELATQFRAALEHVVGPQKQVATISIGPEDDIERRRGDIVEAVSSVDSGSGVVLLTDMFGGTPSNLAISVMNGAHVEVVAGINLPMLIKLASVRDAASLEQAVIQAQDAGRKYIYVASRVLAGK